LATLPEDNRFRELVDFAKLRLAQSSAIITISSRKVVLGHF